MSHLWFVLRWLHLLAMAFFVGGQIVIAAVVLPSARSGAAAAALRDIARRFGRGTLVAFAVLLATGSAMASHAHLWGDSTFQLKLGLVAATAILLLWHVRRPNLHVLEALAFLLSLAITWIGLYLANGYS